MHTFLTLVLTLAFAPTITHPDLHPHSLSSKHKKKRRNQGQLMSMVCLRVKQFQQPLAGGSVERGGSLHTIHVAFSYLAQNATVKTPPFVAMLRDGGGFVLDRVIHSQTKPARRR